MTNSKNPTGNKCPITFPTRDQATKNRIREHLTIPNDSITESDIRNTKTDTSLFTPEQEDNINNRKEIQPHVAGAGFGKNKKSIIEEIEPNIESVWNISDK